MGSSAAPLSILAISCTRAIWFTGHFGQGTASQLVVNSLSMLYRGLPFRSLLLSRRGFPRGQGLLSLLAIVLGLICVPTHSQAQNGLQSLPQLEPAPTQPDTSPQPPVQPAPTPSAPAQSAPTPPPTRPLLRVGSQGEAVSELQALLQLLGYYSGDVDGVYRANTAAAVSAFQQATGLQADGVVGSDTWNRLLPASSPPTAAVPTSSSAPVPSPTLPAAASTPTPTPAPAVTSPESTPEDTEENLEEPAPIAPDSPAASGETATSIDLPVLRAGMRGPAVARLQERLQALGFYRGAIDGVFGAETETAVQEAQRSYELEPDGIVGADTWTNLLR